MTVLLSLVDVVLPLVNTKATLKAFVVILMNTVFENAEGAIEDKNGKGFHRAFKRFRKLQKMTSRELKLPSLNGFKHDGND